MFISPNECECYSSYVNICKDIYIYMNIINITDK